MAGEVVNAGGSWEVERHAAAEVVPLYGGDEGESTGHDGEDGDPGVLGTAVEQRLVMSVAGAWGSDADYDLSISWVPNRP